MKPERNNMRRSTPHSDGFRWARIPKSAVCTLILSGIFPAPSIAQQHGQNAFSSPEKASQALVAAAQNNDEKAMLGILGARGKPIVSSGDAVEDAQNRANFVQKYMEMHRLVAEPDGTTTLYIGAENWPTPIPLVQRGGAWYFDTQVGRKEILYRRIGQNEASAIRVCQELVEAQKEYHASRNGEYAQRIFSEQGTRNGLYWKVTGSEPQSPIGPLVALAAARGYQKSLDGTPTPYRGYFFRILTRQGKNGPGGSKSYLVGGKMVGGFAFVAYPAEYRSSGVMTFIVGPDGVVAQKDLGRNTEALARGMQRFDPDADWQAAEAPKEEAAGGLDPK
jgi:Protein of unknown function (DUF2950)